MRFDVSDHRRSYAGGEVCDLPDDQAVRWLGQELADPVTDEEPETGTLATGERAVMPRVHKRG
jgi:hypothetical protein